jgi:phospholipid transport system substrate-binding protein
MSGFLGFNRLSYLLAAPLVAVFVAWQAPQAAAASQGDEAEAFIQNLGVSAIEMLDDIKQSDAERELQFRRIVRSGFALKLIGRFVVGRHWRAMNKQQKTEYQKLFAEWLMKSYAGRLGGFKGQKLEILKSMEAGKRDVFVRTHVVRANGMPINADWRVRKFKEGYKIIDIVVEGVSMAAAQKSEFDSVIRKVGVAGLIDNLRSRLAMIAASTG